MSKNHMAEVAALLGVEPGQSFKISDDTYGIRQSYYRLTEENSCEISGDNTSWVTVSAEVLKWLVMGDVKVVKLPWKPAMNGTYYYPTPSDKELWERTIWVDSGYDSIKLSRGLVFKTSKEAAEVAKKMLAVAKEVRNNG